MRQILNRAVLANDVIKRHISDIRTIGDFSNRCCAIVERDGQRTVGKTEAQNAAAAKDIHDKRLRIYAEQPKVWIGLVVSLCELVRDHETTPGAFELFVQLIAKLTDYMEEFVKFRRELEQFTEELQSRCVKQNSGRS